MKKKIETTRLFKIKEDCEKLIVCSVLVRPWGDKLKAIDGSNFDFKYRSIFRVGEWPESEEEAWRQYIARIVNKIKEAQFIVDTFGSKILRAERELDMLLRKPLCKRCGHRHTGTENHVVSI